ncbi:aminotransferase-like domain-containing protein [Methanogenium organophilum]|uniref:PLP-dependent aminotransferase family protein n=1 Tax=Methanogenium organophilum TaxID=2199 RepID=A0A9X9T719_METOG|nr:PLP-dependent aminotransferase family protein [Methanogenium organophilum]WAI00280.1 PLP-dependent aminotransferase family protein [Methanogenium organophilum]
MNYQFARRLDAAPESFLDRLFAVSRDPEIISFAGGLPMTSLIDVAGIRDAAAAVFADEGEAALQYTTTDGYLPLREYIAGRYRSRLGLPATAGEIRITNGSQQCLDLIAKIFVDPSTVVGMEQPGYLGAIEAFSYYQPRIKTVQVTEESPDMKAFSTLCREEKPVFFYGIPNFQNPSGTAYSDAARRTCAEICQETETIFYEDDAFGELAFDGRPRMPVKKYAPECGVMSGSFSKTVSPGMRIGWVYAPGPVIERFDAVRQAADLHPNALSQAVMHRYLTTHDYDGHLRQVRRVYETNCRQMCDLLDDLLTDITHTTPEGGMFMLATMPEGKDSMALFHACLAEKVAVLPGVPFYAEGGGHTTFRLNFSTATEEEIRVGMTRLARAYRNSNR